MKRGNITLNNPQRFEEHFEISKEKLDAAIKHATDKLGYKMKKYGICFPQNVCDDPIYKIYPLGENNSWISGLHTGCFLIAYELTGDKKFLDVATSHLDSYIHRINNKINLDDHDVGFVFSPGCVAYYKLTGDERAKKAALDAAEHLYNYSYSQKGGFILRVARLKDNPEFCRTMMDTLMNIPLFYWAYEMTGDKKFLDAANSQVDITANHLIRPDGSSYHHYQFDVETHAPLYGCTFQGHRDESTWSRGHSWGVLGFPIAYSYTKRQELLALEHDVAYYMLNHLPEDFVPYWDYDFIDGDEPRDSSAGAIAVCGLLDAAKFLPDSAPEKEIYNNAAHRIMNGLIDTCTNDIGEDYDGIMYKVTGARMFNMEIEGCATYGDMFYFEALKRMQDPEWKHLW